ncbi:MAG: TetR/AcrR family transcriptional regulator [Bacteroidales bacterium]|nr:TetR/AcrR family transcriptional regulator [Bacteroidales bacterium]
MISQSKLENKRDRILLAARRLFVNQGFHSTPTSAIAREASVANGTLFHYFNTKEELINTLYKETKRSFFTITPAGVENEKNIKRKVRLLWYNTVKWALNRPQDFLFIQQYSNSPFISQLTQEDISEHIGFYYDLIDQGKEKGTLKDIPTDLMYQLTTYQIYGIINYLFQHKEFQNNSTYLSMAFEFYWESIAKK